MNVWVEAARPKTLTAGLVPVVTGTAASGQLIAWRFAAALVVAVAIQVGTNYANDYFDAVRGVDTPARLGPRRVTAAGLVTRAQMRRAIALCLLVAAVPGVALSAAAGPGFILIGALAFAAALGYSGGPWPYAAAGLGEVFVFIFFGVVATVGAAYVQVEQVVAPAVAACFPVGLLAAAILVANNVRDIDTDGLAGRRTLAVRLGRARTRTVYAAFVLASFLYLPAVAAVARSPWPLLALGTAPLALGPVRLVATRDDAPGLIAALVGTARLHLVFGLLLAVGLWLS